MWFFKKNKSKKRKYVVRLTDYEALKLTNAMTESILIAMRDIEDLKENPDDVVLYDLINTKYALMKVMKAFGSAVYDDELAARKTINREMKIFHEELKEKKSTSTPILNSVEIIASDTVEKNNTEDELL